MTTDTAVRVTRMVAQEKSELLYLSFVSYRFMLNLIAVALDDVPYVDHPEIRRNKHETTEMPFRYVKDANNVPIMPEVRGQLSEHEDERDVNTV